jgi:FMN phosphatase YigB (HAD superfamily)
LEKTGLAGAFDAVIDGNDISRPKPDPEVFIKAALALNVPCGSCAVVEDAPAGIDAAKAAGMTATAIGGADVFDRPEGFSQNPVGFGKIFRKSGLTSAFSYKSKIPFPKAEVLGKPPDYKIYRLNEILILTDPRFFKGAEG